MTGLGRAFTGVKPYSRHGIRGWVPFFEQKGNHFGFFLCCGANRSDVNVLRDKHPVFVDF